MTTQTTNPAFSRVQKARAELEAEQLRLVEILADLRAQERAISSARQRLEWANDILDAAESAA
jgi:hypothetical protein